MSNINFKANPKNSDQGDQDHSRNFSPAPFATAFSTKVIPTGTPSAFSNSTTHINTLNHWPLLTILHQLNK